MDQILKDVERTTNEGIDKFLLFTCAFIESKNYEGKRVTRVATMFDEGEIRKTRAKKLFWGQ